MRNYSWATLLRFFVRLATIIRIAILARILTQAEFGLFGVATIVLSLLEILTETGINVFLIQEKDPLEKYLNTAWVISIVRGLFIFFTIIVLAPTIASFFNAPLSLPLLYITAFVPLIRGLINPASVRFQKELRFDKEFYFRFSIIIVETISVVTIALLTKSALAFVLGMLIAAIFEGVLSYVLIRPWPQLKFSPSVGMKVFRQGKWITGMGLLDYIYTTGDNIIVGRYLGQSALGVYQNAYKLSTLPLTELVGVYNTVSFPAFSKISHQGELIKRTALRNMFILLLMLLLSSLGLYFFSYPLVLVVLGRSWLSAVPVVQVLAFLGLSRGVIISLTSLFLSQKQQRYVTIIGLCSALGMFLSIVPFVQKYGLLGAAYAAMLGSISALPLGIYFTYKLLKAIK